MSTNHDNGQPADADTIARLREQIRRNVIAKAARLRVELARDDVRRFDNFATAVLRVAGSARLLRDIAECSRVQSFTGHDNTPALQAGRYVEQEMSTAIAELIGVDVLTLIGDALEPTPEVDRRPIVIHAGDPVYALPPGWAMRQLDPRPAFHLTEAEALEAFEAIAARRLWAKCGCEASTGFGCRRCKRDAARVQRDPDFDPVQRIAEVAHRWAVIQTKRRRVGGAT